MTVCEAALTSCTSFPLDRQAVCTNLDTPRLDRHFAIGHGLWPESWQRSLGHLLSDRLGKFLEEAEELHLCGTAGHLFVECSYGLSCQYLRVLSSAPCLDIHLLQRIAIEFEE